MVALFTVIFVVLFRGFLARYEGVTCVLRLLNVLILNILLVLMVNDDKCACLAKIHL